MSSTMVIAECGSCHDNRLEQAGALIVAAKTAGADVAKFQFWSSAERLAERRRAPEYLDVYRRYAMPVAWLPMLAQACDTQKIEFMCTAYLPEDIAVVAPYVRRFKVASFEAGDALFLDAHRVFGKPLIVSMGMQDNRDSYPSLLDGDTVLHCVSAYPAPVDEMNLAVIRGWRETIENRRWRNLDIGLSDHTLHVWTGALAVVAGATVLERHLRLLDTDQANPDFRVASLPDLFRLYVEHVRLAEVMLGDGHKRLMPSESAMAKYRV